MFGSSVCNTLILTTMKSEVAAAVLFVFRFAAWNTSSAGMLKYFDILSIH